MKKQIPTWVLAVVAVVALGIAGFFVLRAGSAPSGVVSPKERDLLNALEQVGGDPSKLDGETKKQYEQYLDSNPNSSRNRFRQGGVPGSAGSSVPGAAGQ